MNSKMAVLFAGALVAGGVFVAMNSKDPGGKEEVSLSERSGGAAGSRTERLALDLSEKALRFLQSVPDFDLNNPPTFAEIQARTKDLTIEQIEELLAEHPSHEGLTGWLRSALWAELGRRNDRASFERLLKTPEGLKRGESSFARDQAVFAFLRGRVEQMTGFDENRDTIIEDINKLSSRGSGPHWQTGAVAGLFSKLVRLDHKAAWDLIQSNDLSETLLAEGVDLFASKQNSAVVGFFRALPSEALVTSYFEEWGNILELPTVTKSYEDYKKQISSSFSGWVSIPPEEVIISNALASLARFNPEAALSWLADHEADPEKPDYNRIHGMWRQLATNYPEQALEIFAEEKYSDPRRANIGWLLSQDFSAVTDAITETPKASHQTQILHSVISSAGSNHVNDFFPTPEGPNRLPNFQQRHDFLLEAINRGTYHEKQKESLLGSLEREFKGKLGAE